MAPERSRTIAPYSIAPYSIPRRSEPPTGGIYRKTPTLYDQSLFMKTLSRFSVVLPEHNDLDATALAELTRSVTEVLGLGGSGVTMAGLLGHCHSLGCGRRGRDPDAGRRRDHRRPQHLLERATGVVG